jgi:hypothetical protein
MKKLLFSFCTLIIFTNVSYASFPVSDTLKVKQDILQTEEIKQYHSNLIKMGVDLNDCRCESCRAGIPIPVENQNAKIPIDYVQKNISKFFLVTGVVGLTIMLYGIINGDFVGLLGIYVLIASVIVLVINFLIKKLKRKTTRN